MKTTKTTLDLIHAEGECLCGCGADTTDGKKFLPGHDAKALHEIIHKFYGNTEEFIAAHHQRKKSGTIRKVG